MFEGFCDRVSATRFHARMQAPGGGGHCEEKHGIDGRVEALRRDLADRQNNLCRFERHYSGPRARARVLIGGLIGGLIGVLIGGSSGVLIKALCLSLD